MHGAVDFVFRERDLELTSEQSLGTDLGERLVELLVARRLERHQFGDDSAREQSFLHESRLTQCKLRRSRPNSYDVRIGLFLRRH